MKQLEAPVREEADPRASEAGPGRRPGRLRWVVLGAILVAAVVGGLSALEALRVGAGLREGERALRAGREALVDGALDDAARSFRRAAQAFLGARRTGFLLRAWAGVPLAGRTPDGLLVLAETGERAGRAAAELAGAVAELPGGLASVAPRGGRIPVGVLERLEGPVARASALLGESKAAADHLPTSWVPPPLAEAARTVQRELGELEPRVRGLAMLLRSLPALAGTDGPRRYFVGGQNSAELRGTGGLIGNFGVLTVHRGWLRVGEFRSILELPTLPAEEAPSPSEDFDALYSGFGGGGFWPNINMTPDAPTAAGLIEALYRRVTGQRLDGTILIDLQGTALLLEATGPVQVPELKVTLSAADFVPFVAQARYLRPGRGPHPAEALIAEAIWRRLLDGTEPEAALRALVRAATEGHLVVHSAHPDLQEALRLLGVAGAVEPRQGDFVGVVLNNAAGNKVDYYLRQTLRYDVSLEPGGLASVTLRVRLWNGAPRGARPSYALGPHPNVRVGGRPLEPGEDRLFLTVYCPRLCSFRSATVDGRPLEVGGYRELGLTVLTSWVSVKPQRSAEVVFRYQVGDVWGEGPTGGQYRLRLYVQPQLHASGEVRVIPPPGMEVPGVPEGAEPGSGSVSWRGPLGGVRDVDVAFRRPLLERLWRRILEFLARPVVRL
ncbi:MAG TPA: DUF4012 domain-containing protein [Actinomycetota bacterium]|nr:DUF4012 domain-containing protein [Actinomycetota bacterium]